MSAHFIPAYLTTSEISALPIVNGQLIINRDNGSVMVDAEGERKELGKPIPINFDELHDLISTNSTLPRTKYLLLDYKFTNIRHTVGSSPLESLPSQGVDLNLVEPLVLSTDSDGKINKDAYSVINPSDTIKYVIKEKYVRAVVGYRGSIVLRIDHENNTQYNFDFRNAYEFVKLSSSLNDSVSLLKTPKSSEYPFKKLYSDRRNVLQALRDDATYIPNWNKLNPTNQVLGVIGTWSEFNDIFYSTPAFISKIVDSECTIVKCIKNPDAIINSQVSSASLTKHLPIVQYSYVADSKIQGSVMIINENINHRDARVLSSQIEGCTLINTWVANCKVIDDIKIADYRKSLIFQGVISDTDLNFRYDTKQGVPAYIMKNAFEGINSFVIASVMNASTVTVSDSVVQGSQVYESNVSIRDSYVSYKFETYTATILNSILVLAKPTELEYKSREMSMEHSIIVAEHRVTSDNTLKNFGMTVPEISKSNNATIELTSLIPRVLGDEYDIPSKIREVFSHFNCSSEDELRLSVNYSEYPTGTGRYTFTLDFLNKETLESEMYTITT